MQTSDIYFYENKNDGEEAVSVSANVLLLYISSYDYLFSEILLMGLGVGMEVSTFLLKGRFLVERMMY